MNSERPDEERRLRHAIAANPDSAHAHAALISHLCSAARIEEALLHLDHETHRRPSSLWPLSLKAGVFSAERRAREAVDVHRKLVAMAADVPILWANFGNDLAALGMVSEAASAYRSAVERSPALGAAWLGLANLLAAPFSPDDIEAMERSLPLVRAPYQRIQMLFALGRALDGWGKYERAFESFAEANALRGTLIPHDAARLAAFVEAHRVLDRSFFSPARDGPSETRGAIFIVGMPRSGSTLVEQILASHPDVEGLGELFALEEVAASMGAFDSTAAFIERLGKLTQADAGRLGTDYLRRVRRHRRTGRAFFTDKMPANWRFVPLIRRILPSARIIDVRRDPMAWGFSAFTTYFNRHTDFPSGLEGLGQYYRSYRCMMTIALKAAPSGICNVDCERLVSDPDPEIRALLGKLRLDFAAECLAPERNRRAIYTPSAQQVRAPVRRTRNRIRDYLPWLGPLRASLDNGEYALAP